MIESPFHRSPTARRAARKLSALLRGVLIVGAAALLSACASPGALHIDRSVQARSQSSRVEVIVLHYTSTNNRASLKILSQKNVSSHYLITDEARPHIYQLVDENRRAWHAGISQWCGRTYLNASSIGIELVNEGPNNAGWAPYPSSQIKVLAALLQDIIKRHQIKSVNVVGHSDIAPQRKLDPGPLFPWKQLADAGIGRWYDESAAARYQGEFERNGLPDIRWTQQQLSLAGYAAPDSGILDLATKNTIRAFQMHYRPSQYDGSPDAQTLAILKALNGANDAAARC
jgi:N-acetylmuramoyl-L-alanine amidase